MSPAGKDAHTTRWHASDPVGYPPLRVAHSRKVMKGEDKWFATPDARWVPPGASPDDPDVHCHFSAFGLFDGHGGKDAAEHCVETMLPCLLAALDARGPVPPGVDPEDVFEDRLPAALEDAFEASDAAFLARDIHSGATATIVIVNGRCVTTAAVGDSLATVDVGAGAPPARLTAEHRLDTSAPERDRIRAAGGEVRATAFEDGKPVGPLRVWPGGLAVSRSVGDRDGKKGGVTSKPEVSRVYVPDEQPGFRLVMASDGLWDAVTVKQAAACGAKLGTAPAAAALCKLAQKQKDNRDDITVVVVDALASVGHKDPFVAKAPWRSEIKARWPLGHRKYDTVPSPSARRAARTDAAAREAAVEAAAAAAAAEAAAEAETTPRRADARWADDAPGNAGAADDDEGWEEVPSSHSMRSSSANDTRATGGKGGRVGRGSGEKEKGRGARGGRGGRLGESKEKFGGEKGRGAGLGAGRGAGRGGRGGRGGGVDAAATARVAAGMENLRVSAAVPAATTASAPAKIPAPRGGATEPEPRGVAPAASVDSETPTKSAKPKRKGKKERAAERAAREAAAAAEGSGGPEGGSASEPAAPTPVPASPAPVSASPVPASPAIPHPVPAAATVPPAHPAPPHGHHHHHSHAHGHTPGAYEGGYGAFAGHGPGADNAHIAELHRQQREIQARIDAARRAQIERAREHHAAVPASVPIPAHAHHGGHFFAPPGVPGAGVSPAPATPGAPGPPLPGTPAPGVPRGPSPATVAANGPVASENAAPKTKAKRKGKRERAQERARLAAAAGAAGGFSPGAGVTDGNGLAPGHPGPGPAGFHPPPQHHHPPPPPPPPGLGHHPYPHAYPRGHHPVPPVAGPPPGWGGGGAWG